MSYNQEIVWDLFNNYVQASEALDLDKDYRDKVAEMRDKLGRARRRKLGPIAGMAGRKERPQRRSQEP